jgi:cytoskeletal protein CcmA (bactofilin family)
MMIRNPFSTRDPLHAGQQRQMKEAENRNVTPFLASSDSKQKQARASAQSSEDIHVGPNTQLVGGFHTQGMMIVDGKIDGADISADRLVVSHIGQLTGKAAVHRAEVSGVFDGELVAEDEVILRPTARISGTVRCQRLVIHRGASLECHFSCAPEPGSEVEPSGAPLANMQRGGRLGSGVGVARDRRLFLAGAGSVFALLGVLGLLIGLRMALA